MPLRSRLGASDGRRTFPARLLPQLGSMPFTQSQKAVLDGKAWQVQNTAPFIHPNLNFFNPPADSDPIRVTPNPFPNYPAVGSGAITIISFTCPQGKIAIIRGLCVVHVGGNPPDGTGVVIWRVLRDGAGMRGLGTLTAQIGTFASPSDLFPFTCYENSTISVTAECPALLPDGETVNPGPPEGSTTAASFDGFLYPLTEAVSPTGSGS